MQVRRQKRNWTIDAEDEWLEVKSMDEVLRMSLFRRGYEHYVYEGGIEQPLAVVVNGKVKSYYTVVNGAYMASGGSTEKSEDE